MTRPLTQWLQRPQAMFGSPVMRSPSLKPVTTLPTASTMPLNSWPRVTGGVQGVGPFTSRRAPLEVAAAGGRVRGEELPLLVEQPACIRGGQGTGALRHDALGQRVTCQQCSMHDHQQEHRA